MSESILKDWVQKLGLRHQGVLLTVIRGCDTAPKDDASKLFTRCVRELILKAHCCDPKKSVSFIQWVEPAELVLRFRAFAKNLDHYPHHYVMHLVHAIEIIGYKHEDQDVRSLWLMFYHELCFGLHMGNETEHELDRRLNADEETFGRLQGRE